MPLEKAEDARWFAEEVRSHGPALRTYIRRSFPAMRDVDDVVQESYLRVWRARVDQRIECMRAFLFRVARHVAIDRLRRDRLSPVDAVHDLDALPVADERLDARHTLSTNEKLRLMAEALAALPARCREVVVLRKLHGYSQREVAERLGISEKTVEAQLTRGVRRCETYLRRRGVAQAFEGGAA